MTITFRATSNNVHPDPQGRHGYQEDVHLAMKQNACFVQALGKEYTLQKPDYFYGDPPTRRLAKPNADARIIQSSAPDRHKQVIAAPYGLVTAIMAAYNSHHDLVLRPDDVWQAILTQFSFYVNANAGDLRDKFVDFEGKRKLTIETVGKLFTTDFGSVANRMVDEQITPNLKDASVTEWLLPAFTTTTPNDRIAASVTIMCTLQTYFEYTCTELCGIPNVTLKGTPDDWRLLRAKIDRLPSYEVAGRQGPVMHMWRNLLAQVLDEFVKSSEGDVNLKFWDTVCHRIPGGSGPSYFSGWITVFSCFRAEGQWQGAIRGGNSYINVAKWPKIDTSSIPVGVVSVPLTVKNDGVEYKTQMLAGHFAYDFDFPTISPRIDWCIAKP